MKKKIWIIDDYLPMLDCMRIVLELHDYEVEIAQDGKGLLDKKNTPDLLLIDYHIPGIDGYSLVEQIKNQPQFKNTPFIIMSGHKDIEQISTFYGANDFIAKPFNFDELVEKIATLCNPNSDEQRMA